MSISSEISRIAQNVSDALTAIANKGVTVPQGSNSDDLATLIAQISGGGTPEIQSLSVTPSTSQQTYNAAGVDGYKPVVVAAMPSGSATAPATISGSSASVSTGANTLTLSKTVSVTPSVTAGYVASGTAGNSNVSLTASVTTQGAQTIHPSTTDQTIGSGRYLTGTQTIKAVTVSGLSASSILSGTTVKIGDSTDDDCVASVSGSVTFSAIYSGSSAPSSALGSNGDIYLQTGT